MWCAMLKVHEDESEVRRTIRTIELNFVCYNLVRWAVAARWMIQRACWNGCSVGMFMTSGGECVPGPNDLDRMNKHMY